jgi:hypothetical protein
LPIPSPNYGAAPRENFSPSASEQKSTRCRTNFALTRTTLLTHEELEKYQSIREIRGEDAPKFCRIKGMLATSLPLGWRLLIIFVAGIAAGISNGIAGDKND